VAPHRRQHRQYISRDGHVEVFCQNRHLEQQRTMLLTAEAGAEAVDDAR